MGKRVLLLNASFNDLGMLQALKDLGCYVITTGNIPNLEGHKLADEYVYCDYLNKEKILQIAIDKKIDAICPCANDHGVRTAAYVSEKLGFKGQDTYENTIAIANKDKFKELSKKLNILTPNSESFNNVDEALAWASNAKGYPLIVKATDLCGGAGIKKVSNKEELIDNIKESFSKSISKNIVVEEYIEGPLSGFCAFLINKKVITYCSDNEYCILNPYKVDMFSIPGIYSNTFHRELIELIEKIAGYLNLEDGIFHIQYINNNGKPYIIECMRRVLGNMYGLAANKYNGFNWDYWQVRAICDFGIEDFPVNLKPEGYYGFKGMYAKENGILLDEVIDNQLEEKSIYKKENIKKGEIITNCGGNPVSLNFFKFNNLDEAKLLLVDRYDKSYVKVEKENTL